VRRHTPLNTGLSIDDHRPIVRKVAILRRKPKFPPTGDPLDDKVMQQLAKQGVDFNVPRDWVHYVYCDADEGASRLQADAESAGWKVRRVAEGSGIVANRDDLPVNGSTVPTVRAFFRGLAASVPGGDYDGWEASV
jgi:hypothetical protein